MLVWFQVDTSGQQAEASVGVPLSKNDMNHALMPHDASVRASSAIKTNLTMMLRTHCFGQDLPRMYLAHHKLETIIIIVVMVICNQVYLGNEDDSEGLKEGCAIHVDRGAQGQYKASNGVSDAMLSSTAQRDRQACNAGVGRKHCDQSLGKSPANRTTHVESSPEQMFCRPAWVNQ